MKENFYIPQIFPILAIGIGWFGHQLTRANLAPPFPISVGQESKVARKMDTNNKKPGRGGGGVPRFATRTSICGVGINDSPTSIGRGKKREYAYSLWRSMIERCYSKNRRPKQRLYANCCVCDEWLRFSNFKKWFYDSNNGYKPGYHLDKDILVRDNKIYSPNTCRFVPPQINTILVKHDLTRGKLPIGVAYNRRNKTHPFKACLRKNRRYVTIGTFSTIEEAFLSYKAAKEAHIKEVARAYYEDGLICKEIYDALLNYTVRIDD